MTVESEDSSLVAALTLGAASAASTVLRERREQQAAQARLATAREETRRVRERQDETAAAARELHTRQATAVPILVAAYVAPAAIGFIQGPSHVGAGPVLLGWLFGFGIGLSLRALAAQAAGVVFGRIFSALTGIVVYLGLGFVLYLVAGSVANGLATT